jgi:NADH-quinone oxidoreductase subunit J
MLREIITIPFAILSVLVIASGVAAMAMRNLVHCALALAVTFVGLAAVYLQLDAQFIGFAQILVYVGAVAILIVFTILLTRSGEPVAGQPIFASTHRVGLAVAAVVFLTIAGCVVASPWTHRRPDSPVETTVQQLGDTLMTKYVLPLEMVALLLTAAMIGAVILAMKEPKGGARNQASEVRSQQADLGAAHDSTAHAATVNPPSSIVHTP